MSKRVKPNEVAIWMRCTAGTFSIQASGVELKDKTVEDVVKHRSRGGTDIWVYFVDLGKPVAKPDWYSEFNTCPVPYT